VLSHVRRTAVLAATSLAALLPLFTLAIDGAKRW
jgi:hypothetical protein